MKKTSIALVGNASGKEASMLNNMLSTEGVSSLYGITLYGADGQPEEEALCDAVDDCMDEKTDIDAIVCLPMSNAPQKTLKYILGDNTILLPVIISGETRYASSGLSNLSEKTCMLHKCLRRDLNIAIPRIAIIADSEENIKETIDALLEKNIQVFGPYNRELLQKEEARAFDAIMTVEENEEKSIQPELQNEDSTIITLLSGAQMAIVSTESKYIYEALAMASDVTKNRTEYDFPLKNPLPKLYVEKREEGDKARYARKKGGFDPAAHKRENVTYTTTREEKVEIAEAE